MKRILVFLTAALCLGCTGDNAASEGAGKTTGAAESAPGRLVTVPGNVTETVFALGMGDAVVGACASSQYPEAVEALAKVGYRNHLNAEGILSLSPDLLIATEEAGPKEVMDQIRDAGIEIALVSTERTSDGAIERIQEVAQLLGRESEGEELVQTIRQDLEKVVQPTSPPKVLFIYVARKTSMVAGTGTAAESMIQLAGGVNAVTEFEDFKPMNPEEIVSANPDYILLDNSGLESLGGIEQALALPGIAETTAGKNRQIIAMDKTLLLGFGPRLAEGAEQLAQLLQK